MENEREIQPTGIMPATASATGRTTISETAVAKVAAIAARKVPGVYALGSGTGRALGALRDVVGAGDLAQGVHVEVGEIQAAVDVNLVAEYGYPLTAVADQVRAAVFAAVGELVGLQVIEVNVEINDVHVPGLNDPKSTDKPRPAAS
jgi:uncharacterized alkaline shock family protein YloU